MGELLGRLLSSDYMPHGHCYLWEAPLVALQVLTNMAIGVAYFSISLTLAFLVYRNRDLPVQWVYLAFGVFIVTCGMTHFMDVWVIWRPNYWVDVAVRTVCAIASVGTAVLILPLVPKVRALVDAARLTRARGIKLEELNVELAALYEKSRETLAEAIPQLVWTATPEGTIDYVNRRWFEYTGIAGLGPDWRATVEPSELEAVSAKWSESLASGAPYEVECRHRRHDGEYRWFLVRALPLRSGGRIVKWFGTATDVHDRKLLAQEREKLLATARDDVERRDVFLAIAAHELKTPLTPLRFEIEGLARAATSGKLSVDRAVTRLAVADRQLLRLERLVVNLLDVSRLTTGRFELERGSMDLAQLVREIAARHAHELGAASCDLTLRLEGSVVGSWDRLRLDEVVTNLLFNAIAYGRGKPITIELASTAASARLDVRDEGPGIAPEDQARIFERFERATSERNAGGLGLGLWLVRGIVEAHGGSVRVESEPERGARFIIELPRENDGA